LRFAPTQSRLDLDSRDVFCQGRVYSVVCWDSVDDNYWLRGVSVLKRGFSGSVDLFLEGKGAVDR
jgi:hypothetical protein